MTGEFDGYKQTSATSAFHNVPRFGHISDMSTITDEDDAKDYALGLLFISCFLLAVFLTWAVLLLVFMCIGKNKIGFMSGRPFQEPSPDADNAERWKFRVKAVRISFFFAGLIYFVFAILLYTEGSDAMRSTLDSIDNSNTEINTLAFEAETNMNRLLELGGRARVLRSALANAFGGNNLCPADPQLNQVPAAYQDEAALVQDTSTLAIQALDALEDFIQDQANSIRESAIDVQDTTWDIHDALNDSESQDPSGVALLSVALVISFMFMVGVGLQLAGKDIKCYQLCLSFGILPFFVLFTLFTVLMCSLVPIGVVVNADFCSGGETQSPDGTILGQMSEYYDENDIVFQTVKFYIQQCVNPNDLVATQIIQDFFNRASNEPLDLTQQLVGLLQSSGLVDVLSNVCNADFSEKIDTVSNMEQTLQDLVALAVSVLGLLACDRIVPIYTEMVYKGTCEYSVRGLTWAFSATLVMSAMAMIMLTLRAAYKIVTPFEGAMKGNMYAGQQEPYDNGLEKNENMEVVAIDDGNPASQPSGDDDERNIVYAEDFQGPSVIASNGASGEKDTEAVMYA